MFFSRVARAAFTIIELLVVVAIILFLAKIMVPRYSQYYARARQTEVAINLTALYTAQQTYFVEHGRFTSDCAALNWQPKGYTPSDKSRQNFYTYGFHVPSGQEGRHFFTGSSRTPISALTGTHAHGDRFIAKAAAIINDSVEVWSITERGELHKDS